EPTRVLPRILSIAAWPFLPLVLVVIAKLVAIGQPPAGLAHAVLDWLAVFPTYPSGGGGKRDQSGTGSSASRRTLATCRESCALRLRMPRRPSRHYRRARSRQLARVSAIRCGYRSWLMSPIALVWRRMRAARLATSSRSSVNAVAI